MADIVAEAVADGHEVTVALPGPGPLVDVLRTAGARVAVRPIHAWLGTWHWVPPVGITRIVQGWLSVPGIEELIREVTAELVVTNTSVVPTGAVAAARAGVPHIWIVRESLRDNPQLRSALPKRFIAGRVLEHSDVLCTISPYVEEQLFDLAGRRHLQAMQVSPNPATEYPPAPPPPDNETRTFLLPGYFSREKGQHRALAALYLSRRRGSNARLRLVGRGSRGYAATLRILMWTLRMKSSVDLVGWTDNLEAEYAQAHFVLTASKNEAFGRTVVESFAHGRPVIGLKRGATAMLLAAGGGMLVEPGTIRQLGRTMAEASRMRPDEYVQLCHRAAARGVEFRQGESQYAALRTAIQVLGRVAPEPEP
jgi:glycosyltransferase involved in cell wall biosynthesis